MKKILTLISIISIVGVLASCGKDAANTEPKPKTCEQIEPCKTALKYATAVEQGAALKIYEYEAKGKDGPHVYDSKEEAQEAMELYYKDYKKYKDKKIEKYGALGYTLQENKSYLYKFKYKEFRKNEDGEKGLTTLIIHVYKKKDKYYPIEVFDYPDLKKISADGEKGLPDSYYSLGLSKDEKEKFRPKDIEF
ncbi:hypothetical protein [Priestia megaterium]|uniref:hypothetical protein n=1 Tax=Priestia megaterium TaxID=1404 RepID=UPI00366D5C73